jgi:hypothetical protein
MKSCWPPTTQNTSASSLALKVRAYNAHTAGDFAFLFLLCAIKFAQTCCDGRESDLGFMLGK